MSDAAPGGKNAAPTQDAPGGKNATPTQDAPGGKNAAPTALVNILSFIFALYLACVFAFHGFFAAARPDLLLTSLTVGALTPAFYFLLELFARRCPGFGPSGLLKEKSRLSWQVFILVAGVTIAVMLLNLSAHYPGGATYDNYRQWGQVQQGVFDDWHPAIHTMLIWLATRIVNQYAFFIAVQMLCFGLLAGWMAATLRAWGLGPGWVAAFAVSLLSARSTGGILLFAWKDSLFTVLALALAVQVINIVLSDAKWLGTWPNRAAFALVVALLSLVRHNGMFFTIPLLALLLVLYMKKSAWECVITALMAAVLILGVRGPLYGLVGVTRDENQGYVEAVGLPMTILCSVYRTEPEALPPETHALMAAIAAPEQWEACFVFGDYNSIKWIVDANSVLQENVSLGELLRMTWQAVQAAPETSLRAALALTQYVWDPNVWDYSVDFMRTGDYPEPGPRTIYDEAERADPARIERAAKAYNAWQDAVRLLTPSKLLQSIGISMLALALAGAYSLRRRRGLQALLLVVPSMAYNIGTMLMLCGGDYRFFQFNAVITLPLVLVCLAREEEIVPNESCGSA
ncbi:MAG: hypothetical protein FWE98_06860 [Oscillospiraceae bacterium]|nr:hypothetical protein [Oscillospiraceae bacterium]